MSDESPSGSEDDTVQFGRATDSQPTAADERTDDHQGATGSKRKWIPWAAAGLVVAVGVAGGVAWWANSSDDGGEHGDFDAQRIDQVVAKFPEGTHVVKGEKTFLESDVRDLNAGRESIKVRPAACENSRKLNTARLVGAYAKTVSAYDKGVQYVVTAEVIPPSNGKRTRPDPACDTVSYQFPDGSTSIASTPEKPKVAEAEVESTRSVTRTADNQSIDDYSFVAWIDDYHAVVVRATSDPSYKPQANPVDPALAKQLLVEGVRLVTEKK